MLHLYNRTVTVKKEKVKKREQINYWVYPPNYSGTSTSNHVTDKSKINSAK